MLRNPQLRWQTSQPFICWECLSRPRSYLVSRGGKRNNFRRSIGYQETSKRPSSSGLSRYATTESYSTSYSQEITPTSALPPKLDIRQRLRQWEVENAAQFLLPPGLQELKGSGEVRNNLTRPLEGEREIDSDEEYQSALPGFDLDDLLDVGAQRKFLRPGDLVELLSYGGQHQDLAVYIQDLKTQSQFYTMSGKWLHRQSHQAQFYVPGFIDAQELDNLRPYLPTTDIPQVLQNIPQMFPQSLPRDVGKPLILKMLNFWGESESAYQAAATKLDLAHSKIADEDRFTYATLNEVAVKLDLPKHLKNDDMSFPEPLLYAVHRCLLRSDIGFRSRGKGTLRAGGQYEILSKKETDNVTRVQSWVRTFQKYQAARYPMEPEPQYTAGSEGVLVMFSEKARELIDESRESRRLTNQGTLGPSSLNPSDGESIKRGVSRAKFSEPELSIIGFIESWAALDSFALYSSLNGIGSAILRATERYEHMDLGPSTAWTFLQEIGVIAPWENRAAFELRIKSGRYLSTRLNLPAEEGYVEDRMLGHRKDWGKLPVYCIDAHNAHEIDDGISIETTNKADEFWIHVHTADPASHIDPEGKIGKYAQSMAATVYMPGDVFSMLPPDYVETHLSLAPGRPCLTFSAKMNKEGDILEYNVTTGIVHNVLFMTPSTIKEVVLKTMASPSQQLLHKIGDDIPLQSPSRPLTKRNEISYADRYKLQLLYSISEARDEQLKARGGVIHTTPKSSTSVSFKGVRSSKSMNWAPSDDFESSSSSYYYPGDPTVQIWSDQVDLASSYLPSAEGNIVRTFMLVAGEVAARWCNDRGIPIPFRVTPRNPNNTDPWEFYQKKVLPTANEEGNFDITELQTYFKMLAAQPSVVPGPHVGIGVEMMAKCTSPLRRFGDLLLHWQVEATLLEEARLGHSLVGNTKDDFLPFSKDRVEAFLPHLDTRERTVSHGMRQAERHWLCHFLVRAWLFNEADIPSKLPFIVERVDNSAGRVYGSLPTFLASARSTLSGDLILGKLKPGDKLEVELEDVNVFLRSIDVKVLGRLDGDRSQAEDH